jgi:SAM-dependent methyltransferase
MRIVDSQYRDDGRPARLIEIEGPDDYDTILERILRENYYGGDYHLRMGGQLEGRLAGHFWVVAEMLRFLRPRRVVDVGCGRGDILRVLTDVWGIDVLGIELSEEDVDATWPSLRGRMRTGDLVTVLPEVAKEHPGGVADLLCGLDIWEHIHPAHLDRAIAAFAQAGTDDALYVVVVPAYGTDRVFGEQHDFPYELNRPEFEAHEPWRFLYADPKHPHIPYAGHLTWADTVWWERTFRNNGLVRHEALERVLHAVDPLLPPSVRSFYVLTRGTDAALARADRLAGQRFGFARKTALAARVSIAPRRWRITFDRSERRQVARWWLALDNPVSAVAARLVRLLKLEHRIEHA